MPLNNIPFAAQTSISVLWLVSSCHDRKSMLRGIHSLESKDANEFNMGNLYIDIERTRHEEQKKKLWCLVIRCAHAMCWAFALFFFFSHFLGRVMKKYCVSVCVCGDQEMNLCNICALLLLFLFVGFFHCFFSCLGIFVLIFFFISFMFETIKCLCCVCLVQWSGGGKFFFMFFFSFVNKHLN